MAPDECGALFHKYIDDNDNDDDAVNVMDRQMNERTRKQTCTQTLSRTQTQTYTRSQGVGHGRGITARGRIVGHRGNSNRPEVPLVQRVGTAGAPAPIGAAAVVVRGVGLTRLSGRGIQRVKLLPNIPGEDGQLSFLCSTFLFVFFSDKLMI